MIFTFLFEKVMIRNIFVRKEKQIQEKAAIFFPRKNNNLNFFFLLNKKTLLHIFFCTKRCESLLFRFKINLMTKSNN